MNLRELHFVGKKKNSPQGLYTVWFCLYDAMEVEGIQEFRKGTSGYLGLRRLGWKGREDGYKRSNAVQRPGDGRFYVSTVSVSVS